MIERVVENWLIRTHERTLEVPFCQLLLGEGYRVVHLSRHGEMEQGKDVLAIDPNGIPCAFQLKDAKGAKITLEDWGVFKPQIDRLVELPIKHPSIPASDTRRAFLVTNGELDEPVRTEITDRNEVWASRGHPKLEVIVKGDLLTRFKKLQTDLWPTELKDVNALLELFLADGRACLDKPRLASLLYGILPPETARVSKAKCGRVIASAAVFTSYALQPHQLKENYVAECDGWVVYASYLLALAERHGLEPEYWQGSLEIAEFAIEQAQLALCQELSERSELIEGHTSVDWPFYKARITWLCGLLAALGLWRLKTRRHDAVDDFLREFILDHRRELLLWGEAALPQFLAVIWYLRYALATAEPDAMLEGLISKIIGASLPSGGGIPDPYHDIEEVVTNALPLGQSGWRESFAGRSYGLETLLQLFARRNWRQRMRWLWPAVSRFIYCTFVPDEPWQFCLWRCAKGELITRQPNRTQNWSELRRTSASLDLQSTPRLLRDRPCLLLLLLIAYPHRLSPEPAKLLDDHFSGIRAGTG